MSNQIGLRGIAFVEFAGPSNEFFEKLFLNFGFSLFKEAGEISFFKQNDIHFFLNKKKKSFASQFSKAHGPSICSMGWLFENAEEAYKMALKRGARNAEQKDYDVPAVSGIGGSLIYFLDKKTVTNHFEKLGFKTTPACQPRPEKGFLSIDHLTNNVYKGTMGQWREFYKTVFEFNDVRTFDIQGKKTGLHSYALRSADGSFCIPINEADEKKSQINEYLEQYNGPGIQHLAFLTKDILSSLSKLEGTGIEMLDIKKDYYKTVFDRVPNVVEDKDEIQRRNVLVDGDDEGYLLQIFTKNLFGPIFIEIIQRKNHLSFGEGNFQALFDSIERDQEKRGVFS